MTERVWDNCSECGRLRSTLERGLCAECRVSAAPVPLYLSVEPVVDVKVLDEVFGELEAPRRRWWQRRARG